MTQEPATIAIQKSIAYLGELSAIRIDSPNTAGVSQARSMSGRCASGARPSTRPALLAQVQELASSSPAPPAHTAYRMTADSWLLDALSSAVGEGREAIHPMN